MGDVNTISHSEHGSIAYSLKEQEKLREALERNNREIRVSNYLKVFLILVIVASMILLYETHVLGKLIAHLAGLSLFP